MVNDFLQYLIRKTENNFIEDFWNHKFLNKNLKFIEFKKYIKGITNYLQDETEVKPDRIKSYLTKVSILKEHNPKLLFSEPEIQKFIKITIRNLRNIFVKNDALVICVFVDSLDNKSYKNNFFKLLKCCANSKIPNRILIFLFKNIQKKFKKTKDSVINFNDRITILSLHCKNGIYKYNEFINLILKIFNSVDFIDTKTTFLWLVDDDCKILKYSNKLNHLDYLLLKISSGVLFSGGECLDLRTNISWFHNFVSFPYKPYFIYLIQPVPYTRGGGGGALFRIKDGPQCIPKSILPGIYINAFMFNKMSIPQIKEIIKNKFNYFINSDPNIPVIHPAKDNLINWTLTRIKYRESWRQSFSLMNKSKARLYRKFIKICRELMLKKLIENTKFNHIMLFQALGYTYITQYYKNIIIRYSKSQFLRNVLKGYGENIKIINNLLK